MENGKLTKGIFYELIKNDVPFVLADSIRDDGPRPEVIMSSNEAQARYREIARAHLKSQRLQGLLHLDHWHLLLVRSMRIGLKSEIRSILD